MVSETVLPLDSISVNLRDKERKREREIVSKMRAGTAANKRQ